MKTHPTNSSDPGFIPPSLRWFLTYLFPYFMLFVMVLGILGNLMSIVIFVRKRKADRVSSQYLGVLAVNDTLLISILGIPMWLLVNLENVTGGRLTYNLQMPDVWGCKVTSWIHKATIIISAWIIIIFSFERMLVIWMPLKMTSMSLNKTRKISLAVLIISANAVTLSHLKFNTLTWQPQGEGLPPIGKCALDTTLPALDNLVYTAILVFANGVPIVLIVTLNLAILVGLKRNQMTEGKSDKQSNTDRKAVINLLLVAVFYVLTIGPYVITWLLYLYLKRQDFVGFTPQDRKDFSFMWLSADVFQYTNYSVNPWIYTFALDFYRAEVGRIFGCGTEKK